MARYFCDECGSEMELLYEENKIICPVCGRWEELSDEEMDDFVGESSISYCHICEHNNDYPRCILMCPYND